jgi:antitoxin MazE
LQAFIEGGHLVLRKVEKPVRSGWEAAAAEIAARGEDALVLGEFGNAEDEKLVW